jgi:putative mycofactocin binding protein MftB
MVSQPDLSRPWQLDPRVELRPESFGALAYHFGTRRLSFLKSTRLRDAVEVLDRHPDAIAACRSVGVADEELPTYRAALSRLAESGMIVLREQAPVEVAA